MVIVFDVNETLLDLSKLKPHFAKFFGDATVMSRWFAQLLQLSMVATITEHYRDFGELAKEALRLTAKRQNVLLTNEMETLVLATMTQLEPHTDVRASLERLRNAGFRLATLTNSPYRILQQQLTFANLIDLFEQTISVDEVRLFKPHPKVYQMAAGKLGIQPNQMRLVAAHNWDTTGATRAGCKAAFVARPGMVLGDLDEQPDIIAPTMDEVVERILGTDKP